MREVDRPDEQPQLGAPIKQPPMPVPPKEIAPGVWKKPDGTLETHIPINNGALFSK